MTKRKMLKLVSLVLALVMAVSLMAGCGAQKETTKEDNNCRKVYCCRINNLRHRQSPRTAGKSTRAR